MQHLDRQRGELSRSEFLRRTIHRSLCQRESGVEWRRDNRGVYDRVSHGLASPETAVKIRRRERNAEFMRAWRASHPDAPKRPKKPESGSPPAEPVVFTFHETGHVTSSDLDPLAIGVGLIDDHGRFLQDSTRHSEARVRSELLAAMEREPERNWPDRYSLFLERSK